MIQAPSSFVDDWAILSSAIDETCSQLRRQFPTQSSDIAVLFGRRSQQHQHT